MNLADIMRETQLQEDRERNAWAALEYTGNACPNCSRVRLELHTNGRVTCEKCNWEPALNAYSPDKPRR